MSASDDLLDQVARALGPRPGWRLEPSSSPGGPPAWCRYDSGKLALSIDVGDSGLAVYEPEWDRVTPLADVAALLAWLTAHERPA